MQMAKKKIPPGKLIIGGLATGIVWLTGHVVELYLATNYPEWGAMFNGFLSAFVAGAVGLYLTLRMGSRS